MRNWVGYIFVLGFIFSAPVSAQQNIKTVLESLSQPRSLCFGPQDALYITQAGENGKSGDGLISVVKDGSAHVFSKGLHDPRGMAYFNGALLVIDENKIKRIDADGASSVWIDETVFPEPPTQLDRIAVLEHLGLLLVSDLGTSSDKVGALYLISVRTKKAKLVASVHNLPSLKRLAGIAFDGEHHVLVADPAVGEVHRVRIVDGQAQRVAGGLAGADGLIWDHYGRLFITASDTGRVVAIPRPGEPVVVVTEALPSATAGCLSKDGQQLLVLDAKSGALVEVATNIPGWEVDATPAAAELTLAFPNLKWTDWDDGSESGIANPLRPLVLTHANDGSNQIYVATQHGVIHVFENRDDVTETKLFLDLSNRTRYSDNQNEEGFLGLAFHPRFKENGEFFVFYTDAKARMSNVVSRFRVKADDPTTADPDSEEELLRIRKPYWNHDGGCLVFGPDGYLYISHGDGGAANDPHDNGQNLKTMLGKVLRIDVDQKSADKSYAIPEDNPFVSNSQALPEIYAYGLRNVWRMAFDPKTKELWGGEVGQNLYEEIVILKAGGNYGWNLRESFHPFGAKGIDVNEGMIEPVWEYHHDIGKSITGGAVYRGQQLPELDGTYIYADYVSGRVWALRYDRETKKVTGNHPISFPGALPILSFGEDQRGEHYALVASASGRSIYRLQKRK